MLPDITRDDVFRLEAARLWLRWPRATDAEAIARIAARKGVADMTASIPHPYPPGAADAWIDRARAANAAGTSLNFVLTLKDDSRAIVGMASVHQSGADAFGLGVVVGEDWWGAGYGGEAVEILVDTVFTLTRAKAVEAAPRAGHEAGRNLLTGAGFAYQGSGRDFLVGRGVDQPVDRYRLVRKDWVAQRRWPSPRKSRRDDEVVGTRLHA